MSDTKRLVIMDKRGTIHVDETKPLTVVPHVGDVWWFAPTAMVCVEVVEEEFGAIVCVGTLGSGHIEPLPPEENILVRRMVRRCHDACQTAQDAPRSTKG